MDKSIIKKYLTDRFLKEETTPGIVLQNRIRKESGKINKDAVKDIGSEVTKYEKGLENEEPNMDKMATNKYNYTDEAEVVYHNEMEILNGQEMIQYSREPGSEFKKRAEEAIEGSSRMGNAIAANAEATWGASSDDFGKNLIKRIKDSSKKRADAEIQTYGMGDVQIPTGNKVQVATTAVGSTAPKGDKTKVMQSASEKPKTKTVSENNNKINQQTNKSMKRLTFKKEFNGANTTQKLGHALTLIPEHYKENNKEFELTDGVLTCRVRWEGNLNEGKAVVLLAADKTMINEDIDRMKTLMGYKPQDMLGLVKGKARISENKMFGDIWNKSKILLGESEDIEDCDAKEGSAESLDDAVSYAPEAKKHIDSTTSSDKGTQAPNPKDGPWEEADVKHAAEAKKHVQGSVPEEKKTNAPEPKEGNWEIKKKSSDATKNVESGKSTNMATNTAKVVKENEDMDDEEETEETPDSWENSEEEESNVENEPTEKDIEPSAPSMKDSDDDDKGGIPMGMNKTLKLLFSPSQNSYWIDKEGAMLEVPKEYLDIAADKSKSSNIRANMIFNKMQDKVNNEPDMFRSRGKKVDEYGDEHPISTTDAVDKMKIKK